ncbi:sulfurtransferase TusA family protein [Metallosphaera tengchongensis]|uniref:Sulfurtransferase TusA family protein n=2 Tax=Metallosphaera tengchongensis TaxID=1532350 RepID=A0A6N0NW26_9CREN|nr:sulfurtransferase TusA family protein [Metallosphaera tengchongensis]
MSLEKYHRLYLLHDLRRLNWGYSGKLKLGKLAFPVLVRLSERSIEILEENGRFLVKIDFKEGPSIKVEVEVNSTNEMVASSIEESITKNLREYGEAICNGQSNKAQYPQALISIMKPLVRKVLDVRGEQCPVPEIASKKELMKMRPGEELEVLVDHPAAVNVTLPEVAKLMNCKYEIFNMGDYVSFIMLKLGNPVVHSLYASSLSERERLAELIKDTGFIAYLYVTFDRIVKQVPVNGLSESYLNFDGLTVVTSASIGRGWLLVSLVEGDKVYATMLDFSGERYWNEEALRNLDKVKGMGHVFYLKPSIPI